MTLKKKSSQAFYRGGLGVESQGSCQNDQSDKPPASILALYYGPSGAEGTLFTRADDYIQVHTDKYGHL